ncbi:protein kinase domain-containing protein [Amnibacterium endophyticum]|uniref:Protein kinase n=1 Tax=Amnibacterium endophyticum TaxID=2109337 RepID=A0ABW4LDQ7_9MICO
MPLPTPPWTTRGARAGAHRVTTAPPRNPVAVRQEPLQKPRGTSARSGDDSLLLEGALLGGRYRLGARIGSGGMATVHAARDLLLGRDVAIKLFRTRAAEAEALRLQEAEARVVAALNHYALTTLFDAGVETPEGEAPQIYLVMELVRGRDLRTRLAGGAVLTATEVAWLGFDLAEALHYVHRSGFIHRDLKPANVLLSDLHGAKPITGKLADFGIAALVGERDTSEYTVGSAAYLSPEQVEGLDATPASDVYSLGLVLLEALTGRVEYPGSIEASAFARLERDPRIPDDLPTGLADTLRRMTAFEPAHRPSPHEVAVRLQQQLVVEGVDAQDVDAGLLDADESSRLAVLRSYDLLDSPPDEVFDTITRLASRMLGVPIALVTLIDLDRVWFMSSHGWAERQVDRSTAFCSTTRTGDGAWSIPDALVDPRTRGNALVVGGPEVRSYAAAPLVGDDGHHLGALCVFDRRPREFTEAEMASLVDLAALVMHEIELRRAARRALFTDRV